MGDVLRAWAGLGYNRRARYLHHAAQVIVDEHRGAVPDSLGALLALPGVGAYTARAVMVFAFEADIGVVDTNAGRVLSRAVAGRMLTKPEAQSLVDAMVPPGQGWLFGESLLDLGPWSAGHDLACHRCPVRRRCRWSLGGRIDPDPARGSAGVSVAQRCSTDSIDRDAGRLVAGLRDGPVTTADLAVVMGWPGEEERAHQVAAELAAEGSSVKTRPECSSSPRSDWSGAVSSSVGAAVPAWAPVGAGPGSAQASRVGQEGDDVVVDHVGSRPGGSDRCPRRSPSSNRGPGSR